MKDYYFSHDRNAVVDDKILEMRAIYGMEGYGCFWVVVEMLSKKDDLKLPLKAGTYAALTTICSPTLSMEQFITSCIEIGLFESDGECFWSNSLRRRAEEADKRQQARDTKAANISAARREAVNRRWERQRSQDTPEIQNDTNGIQTDTTPNTNAIQKDTLKEKEKKRKTEDTRTRTREEAAATAAQYLEDNLMSLSSGNWEDLRGLYDDGITDELVVYAVDEACAQGKRTWGYVRSILNKCVCEGIKTLEQVRDREKRRQAEAVQKTKNKDPSPPPTLKPFE